MTRKIIQSVVGVLLCHEKCLDVNLMFSSKWHKCAFIPQPSIAIARVQEGHPPKAEKMSGRGRGGQTHTLVTTMHTIMKIVSLYKQSYIKLDSNTLYVH